MEYIHILFRTRLIRHVCIEFANTFHTYQIVSIVIRFFPPNDVQHGAQLILLDRAAIEVEVHFNLI